MEQDMSITLKREEGWRDRLDEWLVQVQERYGLRRYAVEGMKLEEEVSCWVSTNKKSSILTGNRFFKPTVMWIGDLGDGPPCLY